MRQLRAAGLTLRAISSELTARGIETKEGLSNWSHTAVSYILKQAAKFELKNYETWIEKGDDFWLKNEHGKNAKEN